jgi:hypothetical protein
MTKQEMTDKFGMLYGMMASSNDVKQMHTFGEVMKRMMAWFIENKPEAAEEFIEELCSIKWRQYLTRNEATEIVRGMKPEAPWDYSTWEKAMEAMRLEKEREGVFNRYALWVAMNQIYTDFGDSIARMMGEPLAKIPAETLVPFVHDMAVSLLTDPDGKYCIRAYHLG